jgi:predicted MFS family arabinose efflux permease
VFLSLLCSDPATAAVIFAFGVAFSMFTLGATWSACMAIGGSHTGTVGAVMNSASQIGAFSSPLISSILFQFHDRWTLPIVMIGWVYALAALAWLFTDSRSGIVEEPGAA